MRRPRTAPLITPFTCREREGEVGKLYFASYTSDSVPYFLPSVVGCLSVCITERDARTTRPDAMAHLQQPFIRFHAVATLYGR